LRLGLRWFVYMCTFVGAAWFAKSAHARGMSQKPLRDVREPEPVVEEILAGLVDDLSPPN
jgi:hypothetical protein